MIKKTAVQLGVVIRGLLFIGFTVQILLGAGWMWGNFLQVQDFGEPESALYRGLMDLTGGCPQILYLLQTGAAFFAVYYFLVQASPENIIFWRSLDGVWAGILTNRFLPVPPDGFRKMICGHVPVNRRAGRDGTGG